MDDFEQDWADVTGGNYTFDEIANNVDLSGLSGGGFDVPSFNMDDFLTELGGMGTDLGPASDMGMDKDLLAALGLESLGVDTGATRSLADALSSDKSIYSLSPDRKIPGTDLYQVGPNQVSNTEDGTGIRMGNAPVEFKKDGSVDWNSLFGTEGGGEPGLKLNNTLPSQDSMNGGTGLTSYIPPKYYEDGTLVKGTGGTMTASGFVPDGSQHALGNPNSWINNPNITGQKGVTSANNIVIPNSGGFTAAPTVTTTPGATKVTPGTNTTSVIEKIINAATGGGKTGTQSGMNPMMMMALMYLLSQMGKGGGSSAQQAVIPKLQANRSQLPYTSQARPGAGGRTYFTPTTYTPAMAAGGTVPMGGGGISTLGGYSDGGRLLRGPGDGVSDSIPATIAGKQPARLADGEFVVPARIVSELGNGSTDAGAKRLYEMMDRVQKARRKTKNVAADTKAHKYLPA